jgi:hypothetical protein
MTPVKANTETQHFAGNTHPRLTSTILFGDPVVLGAPSIGKTVSNGRTRSFHEYLSPTPVNLDEEGRRDWMCLQSINEDSGIFGDNIHSKLAGGCIEAALFNYRGDPSHFIVSNESDSLWAITSKNDCHTGSFSRRGVNPLISSRRYVQLKVIGFREYLDCGFALAVRAGQTERTLNLYFMFSSGDESPTNQLEVTTQLEDRAAADRSYLIAPMQTGKQFYKLPITFRADVDGILLRVMVTLLQKTADPGTQIGFQAATLA